MASSTLREVSGPRAAERRPLIVLGVAVALVFGVVPGAAADEAIAFSFEDPAGDATYAPDVQAVQGTWGASDPLSLNIALGNLPEPGFFGEFQYMVVGFDVDLDGRQDFSLLSTGGGGTRICEREPGGDPNVFVCVFDSERVAGYLLNDTLHIELIDTELLDTVFRFSVFGGNESLNDTDFAGPWTVALVDDQPPEIQVAIDPITLWPTQPDGNDVFQYGWVVRAVDLIDPDPELVCDPPSGSLFPIGETEVTCTATDDAGNTSTATFTVIVLSPIEVLKILEATVSESEAAPARGLGQILAGAVRLLSSERPERACSMLDAFIAATTALEGHEQVGVLGWWAISVDRVSTQILECGN